MKPDKNFTHDLIKGRIAESIFEQMFRETDKFSVFRFGYEFTEEYLAQHRLKVKFPRVVDNVSDAPDFLLITENKDQVYLVEVKYRAHFDSKHIQGIAAKMLRRWDPSHLFIISKSGFYFSPANTILNKDGLIEPLPTNWVSKEIQDKYLHLVENFLSGH